MLRLLLKYEFDVIIFVITLGCIIMTQLKVRQIGNSLGVVLPKEILLRLNVKDGDSLFVIEGPDGSMRITPYDPAFDTQMQAAREGMAKYRNTLRELAK